MEKTSAPAPQILPALKKWVTDRALARLISAVENEPDLVEPIMTEVHQRLQRLAHPPVLGITGTGGAGKSSLVDELLRRFLLDFADKHIAIISVDPSKRRSGGALLGDRIRMNAVNDERVFMRSLATRQSNLALSRHMREVLAIMKAAQFDLIILETSGIGQSDTEIVDFSDLSLYVMTPDYGAATQLEKIDMLDYADIIAINKFDKRGALDGLRDVKKQYKRNHQAWAVPDDELPVFGTIASQFNDPGTNRLYSAVMQMISEKCAADLWPGLEMGDEPSSKVLIIPPARARYLSEITAALRAYDKWAAAQAKVANQLYGIRQAAGAVQDGDRLLAELEELYEQTSLQLEEKNRQILEQWDAKAARYQAEQFVYQVRGRDIQVSTHSETLSHNRIPRVLMPRYEGWGDRLRWSLQENVPGEFPFTAGVFPFKRTGEDPTRMFAGEGGPERTNGRFHYVSLGMPARRLSTAFDSVTLYGEDPA